MVVVVEDVRSVVTDVPVEGEARQGTPPHVTGKERSGVPVDVLRGRLEVHRIRKVDGLVGNLAVPELARVGTHVGRATFPAQLHVPLELHDDLTPGVPLQVVLLGATVEGAHGDGKGVPDPVVDVQPEASPGVPVVLLQNPRLIVVRERAQEVGGERVLRHRNRVQKEAARIDDAVDVVVDGVLEFVVHEPVS